MSWRPDSEDFATVGADGHVRVWESRTHQPVAERRVADGHIAGVDYTADGSRLVIGERSGRVVALDAASLHEVGSPAQIEGRLSWLYARSRNDVAVAITEDPEGFGVIDLERGSIVRHEPVRAWGAELSPDGSRLALAGAAGVVGLYDIDAGEWVRPMEIAHRGSAFPISYAPDGSQFATSGQDDRVLLWDAESGELKAALPAGFGFIPNPAFLPDGQTLTNASVDSPPAPVHRWDTRLEHWIEYACGSTQVSASSRVSR